MEKLIKDYKEYKNYHRIGNPDQEHLKELWTFIGNNINEIEDSTWFDMAGGFMMFTIQLNGSTYCIGNDIFDEENDTTIYHNLSLKAFIELEQTDYDLGLLPHEHTKI